MGITEVYQKGSNLILNYGQENKEIIRIEANKASLVSLGEVIGDDINHCLFLAARNVDKFFDKVLAFRQLESVNGQMHIEFFGNN